MLGIIKKIFTRNEVKSISNLNNDERDVVLVLGSMKCLRNQQELDDINAFRVTRDSMVSILNLDHDSFILINDIALKVVSERIMI